MWAPVIASILRDNANEVEACFSNNIDGLESLIDIEDHDLWTAVKNRLLPPDVIWRLCSISRYWRLIDIATLYGRKDSINVLLTLNPNLAQNADISLAIKLPALGIDSVSIIHTLLKFGANPNGVSNDMLHLLYNQNGLRMQHGSSLRELVLQYGADPNIESLSGHKPHEHLWPENKKEAEHIITLVQHGATYSKDSIGQLLFHTYGPKVLAHLDCSQIPSEYISKKVKEIMTQYDISTQLKTMHTQPKNRFYWEKRQLLKLKQTLQYGINKMHSGQVPSLKKLCQYQLIHVPRFHLIIQRLATWIKVYDRRLDGDESFFLQDMITSTPLLPSVGIPSLKLMCLKQVCCSKLFGPVLLK
ncbi:MAG: hypothetical protein VXW87_04185 [Pseudomonadota bacterium]|nr:hypothetical protein [Pseudomonadota bacterium]